MLGNQEKKPSFEKKDWHSKRVDKKNKPDSTAMAYIHVVGGNHLQNDLLLLFLMEKTGFNGKCIKNLESVAPVLKTEPGLPQFLLLDWTGVDSENIWNEIDSWKSTNSCCSYFAFCNVDPKVEIEKMALTNNIQGLFYKNDPLDIIPKGVCCILKGDLWYSRKILTKFVQENNLTDHHSDETATVNLTLREKEILILMASGCSNKEVAGKLNLSSHTIKTHIYNTMSLT